MDPFDTIWTVVAVVAALVILGSTALFTLFAIAVALVVAGLGMLIVRGGISLGKRRRSRDRANRRNTMQHDRRRFVDGPLGQAGLIQY
jgi:heme A synthase